MLEKFGSIENQAEKHMFSTNLIKCISTRDLAFGISFDGEIVTKGAPPKCFQAFGVIFFSSWPYWNRKA